MSGWSLAHLHRILQMLYYRAVRGHVMAYEALCRIKWKLFQSWAGKRSSLQDLDDEVKLLHDLFADKHNETVDVEISEQILQLLQTLKERVIINRLWIQFNKIFSENPNYSYCLTHIIWSLLKLCLNSSEPTKLEIGKYICKLL